MHSTRSRVLQMLKSTPRPVLPSVTLRGNSTDVHSLSLLVMGAILGIVATALLVYVCQPKYPDPQATV